MVNLAIFIQIIAIIVSFSCVVLLIMQKSSNPTKLMLLTSLCAFVQNAGYYFELRSTNVQDAMVAVKVEYIGGAFIMTMLMIFVFSYCRIPVIPYIKYTLIAIDILVLICVWNYEYIPFYYSGAEYISDASFPHLVLQKGFLYIIFSIALYCEFIASSVISLISAIRTDDPNMRKNCILLFLSCAVPCLFYMSGVVGLTGGYDPAPLGGAVGIIIFGWAIVFRRVFDVVETAHENILMELEDAIIVLDYRRGFQEANKVARKLFPELNNVQYGQLVASSTINNLIDHRTQDEVEIDGRYYRVHVNDLYSRNGIDSTFVGYSIIFFDVTDAREQLNKMTELKVAADSANQAKSSFLANVSHEIRTPINVVVGMSDVILRDYEEPQLLSYAQNIQTAANTLLDLINDILDFSKIESGRVSLVEEEYRVDDLFRDIIMVFQHKKNEKNLYFTTNIDAGIPRILYGDAVRLRQIVTNILTNAFKYTREGGVTFRAAFERVGNNKGNFIISVEDTGIGIRREELDKVFEMFVRLDERLNRSVEGTGLGLNITKKLVEAMGGEIKVYSEYGKGSVFTVIIPQVIRSSEEDCIGDLKNTEPVAERKRVGYDASGAKVLIIDDSKTNLIVAKALLRDTKAKVVTGLSGEECLKHVAKEHFDVIFLDHRMPGMDGVETLHKMRLMEHMCEDTPVIMLTANAVNNARDFYLQEGFSDFISKPICEESITSMLKKYLPSDKIREV